jgi:hypothetical protein
VTDFRALICLTTCNRNLLLRRYCPQYIAFCRKDRAFDFVVALDGDDAASLDFCRQFGVPLVHSDQREGVGLSKNRVLRRFPGYDYYFFIEDDAELVDARVFREHIRVAGLIGLQHLSLFDRDGPRGVLREESIGGHRLVRASLGGAQFNFFTRRGLDLVGGWHTAFAQYRRYGHTEHSYRFVHQGLADAPFVVIKTLSDCVLWHYPPPVTSRSGAPAVNPATQLTELEESLIAERLAFFPLQTLCASHFNDMPLDCSKAAWADDVAFQRYPCLGRRERRRAWADYFVALSRTQTGVRHWLSLLRAAVRDPGNLHLRYVVKAKIRGH